MGFGIALIGNPGTGKSTILNGLVGKPEFSSGLSYASGRTDRLQKYKDQDGKLYFDTPGLNDIDKRKEAGREIDQLLRQDMSLKIVFVTFALNGRIQPEDATTINVVLDAITSVDTNDRFGVIINQAPAEWINGLKSSPLRERRVRSSLTGKRFTSHWCYVAHDDALQSQENGMLMTDELSNFFNKVPETRPVGATVKEIDTVTFEEKLEKEREDFEERERVLKMELSSQQTRMKMLEMLAEEFKSTLEIQQTRNESMRLDMDQKRKDLELIIKDQAQKIVDANEEAKNVRADLEKVKQNALENEERAKEELKALEEKMLSEWGEHDISAAMRSMNMRQDEWQQMWFSFLDAVVAVAPVVATALALL